MVDHQYLVSVLSYDPESGDWYRMKKTNKNQRLGKFSPTVSLTGYLLIKINKVQYLAHRLAWFHFHGEWPKFEIDHINGDRLDNRITNLRDVSGAINNQNVRGPRKNTKTGVLGAFETGSRFYSRITVDGKTHRLGVFSTKEEAGAAYVVAKRKMHLGCTI